ncbi:MAG: hypothetical protein NVS9B6_06490 [Candidatus Limnocylindrales bacterium]
MTGHELPRPSIWPVTLAAGLALAVAGAATGWVVGLSGAGIALFAVAAWVRDVVAGEGEG